MGVQHINQPTATGKPATDRIINSINHKKLVRGILLLKLSRNSDSHGLISFPKFQRKLSRKK